VAELGAGGLVFQVETETGRGNFTSLDFSHINWMFVASMLPQIVTIVVLCLFTIGITLSALEAGTDIPVDFNQELRSHAAANLGGAICLGMPGSSDDSSTIMAKRMGGSSRILPLTGCVLYIVAALVGGSAISYVP